MSGRSFGPRKITLRVDITVDYDGPSLSDTSSLASLDDFRLRNGSQQSFSLSTTPVDIDDDSVTVSSRDLVSSGTRNGWTVVSSQHSLSKPRSPQSVQTSSGGGVEERSSVPTNRSVHKQELEAPPSEDYDVVSASERYPSDPALVFERLRLSETLTDDNSIMEVDGLAASERGAAWLRDQNERAIRSKLGALPEPSDSDVFSLSPADPLGGDLALERDPRGKYYYTYTSGSASQAYGSIYDEGQQSYAEGDVEAPNILGPPRPTSMQLNWLASQRVQTETFPKNSDIHDTLNKLPHIIDEEPFQFSPCPAPPEDIVTDCSNCGVILDAIRYVCSTCGPKSPLKTSSPSKGKDGRDSPLTAYSYPPGGHAFFSSPNFSTSQTIVAGSSSSSDNLQNKPLPTLPSSLSSLPSSLQSIFRCPERHVEPILPSPPNRTNGYELCAMCLETVGVHHAIEAGLAAPGSSPVSSNISPASRGNPELASQWRRSAPKKGQMRHAYKEKVWAPHGWEDVGACCLFSSEVAIRNVTIGCFSLG